MMRWGLVRPVARSMQELALIERPGPGLYRGATWRLRRHRYPLRLAARATVISHSEGIPPERASGDDAENESRPKLKDAASRKPADTLHSSGLAISGDSGDGGACMQPCKQKVS